MAPLVLAALQLLLICTFGTVSRAMYPPMDESIEIAEEPDPRCKYVGQYLSIPGESCRFLVCDYGNEPWKDDYGNVQLFTVSMPCAPGTFVPSSGSNGKSYGRTYPCSGLDLDMCLPKPKTTSKHPAFQYGTAMQTVKKTMTQQKSKVMRMGSYEVKKLASTLSKMLKKEMQDMKESMVMAGYGPMEEEEMEKMDEEWQKMERMMRKMNRKPSGYGSMAVSSSRQTRMMKGLCLKMLDMVEKMVEMKKTMEEEEAAPSKPTYYGMMKTPLMKMKDMLVSYSQMMDAEKPMMTMMKGYGGEEEQAENDVQDKVYYKPSSDSMTTKTRKMMSMIMKMMKKRRDDEYPWQEEEEETPAADDSGYMVTGYGEMKAPESEDTSGYGSSQDMAAAMGYGGMEEMKDQMGGGYQEEEEGEEQEEEMSYHQREQPMKMRREKPGKIMVFVMTPKKKSSSSKWY